MASITQKTNEQKINGVIRYVKSRNQQTITCEEISRIMKYFQLEKLYDVLVSIETFVELKPDLTGRGDSLFYLYMSLKLIRKKQSDKNHWQDKKDLADSIFKNYYL